MSSNSKKIDIIERKLVKYNVRKDKYVKIKKNGNEREKENADKRLKEVNIRIRQHNQEIKLRKEMGKNITKLQGMDFDEELFATVEQLKGEIEELNKQMKIPVHDLARPSSPKKKKSSLKTTSRPSSPKKKKSSLKNTKP